MVKFIRLLSIFLFFTLSAVAQYPTEQPMPKEQSVELPEHFQTYGKYYIIGLVIIFIVLAFGYITRWGKNLRNN